MCCTHHFSEKKYSPFFPSFFAILLNRNSCICCTFHYYLHFKDGKIDKEREKAW